MSSLLQYIHHDTHMNRVSFSRIKPHFCTVHHWYSSSGVPLAPPPCGVPPWKATVHGGDSCGLPLTQTVRLDPAPPPLPRYTVWLTRVGTNGFRYYYTFQWRGTEPGPDWPTGNAQGGRLSWDRYELWLQAAAAPTKEIYIYMAARWHVNCTCAILKLAGR